MLVTFYPKIYRVVYPKVTGQNKWVNFVENMCYTIFMPIVGPFSVRRKEVTKNSTQFVSPNRKSV